MIQVQKSIEGALLFMKRNPEFFLNLKNIHVPKCLRNSTNVFIFFKIILFILFILGNAHKWSFDVLALLPNKVERPGRSTFLADVIMDLGGVLNTSAVASFTFSFQSILTLHNTTLLVRHSSMFAND